jgi:hypothetical protein
MPILNKALLSVSGLVAEAQTLTFASTITPDMTNCNNFIINIPVAGSGGGNFTLNGPTAAGSTPSSAYDMAIVVFRIMQPSERQLTYI